MGRQVRATHDSRKAVFSNTDIGEAPWYTIEADDRRSARLNCISHILERTDYRDALPGPIELPPRPPQADYQRPPKDQHRVIDPDFWENAAMATDGTAPAP